jgi:integrase
VTANPCANLDLPAVRGRRERIPSPPESAALRRGELLALQWDDADLAGGVIHVRRAMDARGSIISPKSAAGVRAVPIAKVLRTYLAAHRLRNGSACYVPGSGDRPFVRTGVAKRADEAWTAAGLTSIGLHDARR